MQRHWIGSICITLVMVGALCWPRSAAHAAEGRYWPVVGAVSRYYQAPATPYGAGHRGIDIAATAGTSVLAAQSGTVAWVGEINGVPMVSVQHTDGLRSTYQPLVASVQTGQLVRGGETLGTLVSGHTSSDALHFGLRNGAAYLDPLVWLGGVVPHDQIRLLPLDAKLPQRAATLGVTTGAGWPVVGVVTSTYGMRVHPITGVQHHHEGIDLAAACGTPVQSPWAGTVQATGTTATLGNYVIVASESVVATYAHLERATVSAGAVLNAGAELGLVGSTGTSTGCHLHFATRVAGALVDPATVVRTAN